MQVIGLTFNPFQENTYLLTDATRQCVVVDPGCATAAEFEALDGIIAQHGLVPVRLLNTHCHVDHICGNAHVARRYNLTLEAHPDELPNLQGAQMYAQLFGFRMEASPMPGRLLAAGEVIRFGDTALEVLFTPGHSAGHVSFYHADSRQVLSGDVLFRGSIGRYDLPGGSFPTLMRSITDVLLPLGDDVRVYPGHGEVTTLGHERRTNPFLLE